MRKMIEGPTCQRIRERLADVEFTRLTVSDTCYVHEKCAYRNLQALHAAKEIYIVSWLRGHAGPWYPVFRFGNGKDAQKPQGRTMKEYRKKHPDYVVRETLLKRAKRNQLPCGRIHVC